MSQLAIIGMVALAAFLSGLIGLDRELANKPAGLRTHMFVGGMSALMVSLGDIIVSHSGISAEIIRSDPIRILEAIVTGVSFLGAGTILRQRRDEAGDDVEGLTTAASLLFVTGVGASVALNQYILAIGVTVLALLILAGLKQVEHWIGSRETAETKQQEKQ